MGPEHILVANPMLGPALEQFVCSIMLAQQGASPKRSIQPELLPSFFGKLCFHRKIKSKQDLLLSLSCI